MTSEGWAFICVIAFWAWISCVIALILKAFPSGNMFCAGTAARWGAVVVILYAIWVTGMLNA